MKFIYTCLLVLFIFLLVDKVSNNYDERQLQYSTVSNYTGYYLTRPKIANLGSLGFVVIWISSSDYSVIGQLFDISGNKIGNNFTVRSQGRNVYASISNLSEYHFLVCVADNNYALTSTGTNNVNCYTYDYAGSLYRTAFINNFDPKISWVDGIILYEFQIIVAVLRDDGRLYFSKHSFGNYNDGGDFTINSPDKRFAMTKLGTSFILVYSDIRNSVNDLYAKIIRDDFQFVKFEWKINYYSYLNAYYPSVNLLNSGGFVIAFDTYNGFSFNVYARIYDANFNEVSYEFKVNANYSSRLMYPSVTGMSNGGLAISMYNWNPDKMFIREYDSNGIPSRSSEISAVDSYYCSGNCEANITKASNYKYILVYPYSTYIFLTTSLLVESPKCQSFGAKINPDTKTSISFSSYISSVVDSVTSLKIVLQSLPTAGVLFNSTNNTNLTTSNLLAYNIISYQPTSITQTTFTYTIKDTYNRESSICTVTLNICYVTCYTCSIIGDSTNHSCVSCNYSFYPIEDGSSNCYTSNTVIVGFYFDSSSSKFKRCTLSNCLQCSSATVCTQCDTNYYLHDSQKICYLTCPDGSLTNNTTMRCNLCVNYCQTCSNTTQCDLCYSSYYRHYLVNQLCLTTCPNFYYNNSSVSPIRCDLCPSNCLTCANSNDCLTCDSGYFLHELVDKKCYLVCPFGYFGNTSTKKCEACSSNCKVCSSATVCTQCNTDYYLLNSNKNCYNICPDGFFNNASNQTCTACVNNCQTCSNTTQCDLCYSSYYRHYLVNQLCLTTCPNFYYNNSSVSPIRCDLCPSNCLTCANSNDCLTCDSGYFLHELVDKKCYLKCPSGYFGNESTKKCDACSSNCATCINSSLCTACSNNYFLHNNICLSNCPDTYFNNISTKVCTACTSNCKNCPDNKDCSICNSDYYVHYLVDSQCYEICPDGYFENIVENIYQCDECVPNCLDCYSSTECTICNPDYYLHYLIDKLCYFKCPPGYYANLENNNCEECSSNCYKCIDKFTCSICSDGFFLHNKVCIPNCPDNYFNHVQSKSCKNCPNDCTNCENEIECYNCNTNYYLHLLDKKCYDVCPDKFYANKTTKQCESCISNCFKCPDNKICTQCDNSYFLHYKVNKECYIENTCPSGYFGDTSNNNCESCSPNCDLCKSPLECTKCIKDFYLFNNYCFNNCPSSYFKNNLSGKCEACIDGCYECFNSQQCSVCSPGFFLYESDKKCYAKCPSGFIGDSNTRKCVGCPLNCESCSSSTQCIECKDQYYLHPLDYLCYNPCPEGYFENSENKECTPCIDNCSKCQDKYECITCKDLFLLYPINKTCVESCPIQYFKNESDKTCQECPPNCELCTDSVGCIKCSNGSFLFPKNLQCLKDCPNGYYSDTANLECKECHNSCEACSGSEDNQCLSCPPAKTLMDKKCVTACSEKAFYDVSESKCVNYDELINDFSLSTPNEIDIETENELSLNINLEFNEKSKRNLKNNYKIIWEDSFGGVLKNANKTLELDVKMIGEGIKQFMASLYLYDLPIKKINKEISFRYFYLVPKIANLTAFEYKQPILLDASLSYYQKDSGSDSESSTSAIKFWWECPGNLNSTCNKITTNILQLSFDNYESFVEENGYTFIIKLTISSDNKMKSLDYPITLSIEPGTASFFTIIQKTKGIKNEDLIFDIKFLEGNQKYDYFDYEYYWMIEGLSEELYLNTRKESSLRVKFQDINAKSDLIQVTLTEKSTKKTFYKAIDYKVIELPFGKCRAEPDNGVSGETLFTVSAENWQSEKLPLKYSFIYENESSIKIVLKEFLSKSFESYLPSGNKFFLLVTDSDGFTASANCILDVKKSKSNANLKYESATQMDKLVEYEILFSNMKSQSVLEGYENFPIQESIGYVNKLLLFNGKQLETNIEKIVSYTNIINKFETYFQDANKIKDFHSLLDNVSNNTDFISKDRELANTFLKVCDKNLERFYRNDSNDTSVLKQNDEIWRKMINSVYSSMIEGEDAVFETDVNRVTISKVSKINLSSIKLMTSNTDNNNIKRLDKKLSDSDEMGDCDYSIEADVCIDKSVISEKMRLSNKTDLGISIHVMKNPHIPEMGDFRYVASDNVIMVSLLTVQNTTLRELQENIEIYDNQFNYSVYLNLDQYAPKNTLKEKIEFSTCVRYDQNYNINSTNCESWYDYASRIVLCKCNEPGLIVNLYDKVLTEESRVAQFKKPGHSIINPYSMGVVFSLIGIVLLLYFLGVRFDYVDKIKGKYLVLNNYDTSQYLIVEYTKYGFNQYYGLFKLFIYMVKSTHPLLSIFSIHNYFYVRGIRVFDLFNSINMTFIFSMVPYWLSKNADFEAVKTKRSIEDMGKNAGDLNVALNKIILSLTYTIPATIASIIITTMLNKIYFENVIISESNKRTELMTRSLKRLYQFKSSPYMSKMKKAFYKVKTCYRIWDIHNSFKQKIIKEVKSVQLTINPKHSEETISIMKLCREELANLEIQKRETKSKMSPNYFMDSPSYIYELNNQDSHFELVSLKNLEKLEITRFSRSIETFASKKSLRKINQYLIPYSDRSYILRNERKKRKISSFTIQFIDNEEELRIYKKTNRLRSSIKKYAYVILYITAWSMMIIMITDVYNKYENNIIKISISPLISVILVKFLITQNIMIFIHTALMHIFGEKVYSDNRKSFNPIKLLFRFFIPQFSQANHKSILAFTKLISAIKNQENLRRKI